MFFKKTSEKYADNERRKRAEISDLRNSQRILDVQIMEAKKKLDKFKMECKSEIDELDDHREVLDKVNENTLKKCEDLKEARK